MGLQLSVEERPPPPPRARPAPPAQGRREEKLTEETAERLGGPGGRLRRVPAPGLRLRAAVWQGLCVYRERGQTVRRLTLSILSLFTF